MNLSSVAVILISCTSVVLTSGSEVREESTEGVQLNPIHTEPKRASSRKVSLFKKKGNQQVPVYSVPLDPSSSVSNNVKNFLVANYSKSSTSSTETTSESDKGSVPAKKKRSRLLREDGQYAFPLVNMFKDGVKWLKLVTHNQEILTNLHNCFPLRELVIPEVIPAPKLMELLPEAWEKELHLTFNMLEKGNLYKWNFDDRVMLYDFIMRIKGLNALDLFPPNCLAKAAFELSELMRELVREVRNFEAKNEECIKFLRLVLQELAHPKSTRIFYTSTQDLSVMYLKTYSEARVELHGFLLENFPNDIKEIGSLLADINQIVRSTALANEKPQVGTKVVTETIEEESDTYDDYDTHDITEVTTEPIEAE